MFGADPSIADQLRASYNQAFNQGEGSTFYDAGMQVGEYTVRSMPIGYDFAGERQGGGFQATKTATNDRNLPLETTYTYDDNGAITGAEVRYFTGSDSGVAIRFDGQGNKIDERGFDYSESWKGAVAPLVSMAAMAFAGPVAQTLGATLGGGTATLASEIAANAIVRGGLGAAQAGLTGGDILKGALTGAATGALGAGGASLANTAAAETLNLTGSQIAADAVRGAVQSGLNAIPGAIVSGDLGGLGQALLTGAVTSGVGSAAGQALSGTGITQQQVTSGLALAQQLQSGKPNISAIANAAAGLVNNPNATVAAKAISLMDTIQRAGGNPMALMGIMEAANQLSNAVNAAEQAGIKRLPGTVTGPTVSVTGGDLQSVGSTDLGLSTFINSINTLGASTDEALAAANAALGRATTNLATQDAIENASTFDSAFSQARAAYGPGKTFTWQGKEYSTDTRTENPTLAAASDAARQTAVGAGAGRGTSTGMTATEATNLAGVPLRTTSTTGTTSGDDTAIDYGSAATSMQGTPLSDEFKPVVAAPQWMKDHLQTGGNVVQQGISNILQLVGEQGSSLVTGLGGRNTFVDRAFTALEHAGKYMELPQVTEATQNVLNRVQNTEGLFNKGFEFVKAVIDNPLSLNMVLREVGQEILPTAAAARATKLLGLAAGVTTDVGLNSIESIGATSRDKYQEYLQKGMTPEQADREAAIDGYIAGGITAATAGVVDAAIAKRFGNAIESLVGRKVGAGATEAPVEGFEEFVIALATGEDLNSALTKSIVGAGVSGKTASTIQTSADVNTALANSFANQGLISIDGSYRPDSVVNTNISIGTDASGNTLTLGDLVNVSLANDNSYLSTTGQIDVNQLISDYSREVLGGGLIDTSGMTADTVLGTSASGTPITAASLGLVGGGTAPGVKVNTNTGTVTDSTVNNTGGTTVTATNQNTGATSTTNTDASNNTTTTSSSNPNNGTDTVTQTNNNTGTSTSTTTDNNAGTSTVVTNDPNAGTKAETVTNQSNNTTTESVTNTNTGVTNSTSTNANTGATTQTTTNTNTGTSTSTSTDPSTGATTNSQTNNNTGTTTSTETNTNTGTTTSTETNTNTGVSTSTETNTNTGTTTSTETNTNTGTTTSTETNNNTGVTTTTQVDPNTNVTTTTQVDPNTNTVTTTQVDPNTNIQTTTVTDTNTNTSTTVNVDVNTGEPVEGPTKTLSPIPPVKDVPPMDVTPEGPVTPPSVDPITTQVTKVTDKAIKAGATPTQATQIAIAEVAARTGRPESDIKETWLGGRFMNKTSPYAALAALFGLTPDAQEAEALSALQRASGVTSEEPGYFSYGSEASPADVIAPYRAGGTVQGHASGGKILSSPLMAAAGGDVPHKGSHYVQGAGGGQDDLIPAKLADGEYVFDAEIVAALGDGSNKEGAKKLDAMRESIRKHKRSGSLKSIPPQAKSPLQYFKEANK